MGFRSPARTWDFESQEESSTLSAPTTKDIMLLIKVDLLSSEKLNSDNLHEAAVLAYRMECTVQIDIGLFRYRTWFDKKLGTYLAKRKLIKDCEKDIDDFLIGWDIIEYTAKGFGNWKSI